MGIANLDAWIISKFEAFVNYFHISPFELARFFWIGTAIATLLMVLIDITPFWTILFVGPMIIYCYKWTIEDEKDNNKGLMNKQKLRYAWRLIFGITFATELLVDIVLFILGTKIHLDEVGICTWRFILLLALYFSACNYWPPARQTSKIPNGLRIGKTNA